jgi:hypothetical protein
MNRFISISGELAKMLFICIPLAIAIYIGLHIGLLIYLIYKKIK